MPEHKKQIAVIGVGNLLLGDEGVGVQVINELKKESLHPSVTIIDGGTAGLDLMFYLEDADYAIIIDCLEANSEPGTVFRLPAEELMTALPGQAVSLHDLNLIDVLHLAKNMNKLPPTVIYGIQPQNISLSTELSPPVQKSVPRLIKLIKEEINNFSS